MRIGIITDETENLVGLGTYILNTVENILKIDKENEYYLIHRKKENHKIYSMAHEIIIPYLPILPFSTYRNFVKVPRILKKYNFDIVHHTTNLGCFLFKSLMPAKNNIETVHDIIPLLFDNTNEMVVKLAIKHLLPRVLKNADKIIAVSHSTKKDIINILNVPEEKIKVIYEGVAECYKPKKGNLIEKKYGLKDYILYVGTLEPKKNVITLIKALAITRDMGIKNKLVLVGKKGWEYQSLFNEIKRLRLENDVIITGYVPFEELPYFYSSAKVFVLPSLYEGFGLPVVEAMSCGTPVITSNRGSLPEIAGNAGIIVDALDIKELASALYNVLNDNGLAKKLSKKSINQAKKFSWKNTARETINIYGEIT